MAGFDWTGAVAASVAMVVTEALIAFALSRRKGRLIPGPSGEVLMRYGPAMRALSASLSLVGVGMVAGLLLYAPPTAGDFVGVGMALVVMGGLSMTLFIETLGVRHRLDDDGFHKGSPWSRGFYLPWRDVEWIRYSPGLRWYVIRGLSGTVRVSELLDGIEDFERTVRDKIPPSRWRGRMTGRRLDAAADGRR